MEPRTQTTVEDHRMLMQLGIHGHWYGISSNEIYGILCQDGANQAWLIVGKRVIKIQLLQSRKVLAQEGCQYSVTSREEISSVYMKASVHRSEKSDVFGERVGLGSLERSKKREDRSTEEEIYDLRKDAGWGNGRIIIAKNPQENWSRKHVRLLSWGIVWVNASMSAGCQLRRNNWLQGAGTCGPDQCNTRQHGALARTFDRESAAAASR
ncbi:hypothetical protein K438DRAFT_1780725 [Mycena galopus ATCC 62051]|nr:hypothetical protein K438DRAFT_1780725 [Mycena galopus ATCC 62051]